MNLIQFIDQETKVYSETRTANPSVVLVSCQPISWAKMDFTTKLRNL